VGLSNSQDFSLIKRVLITLVLRQKKERRFQARHVNRLFRVLPGFMGKSLVIAVRSSTERNNKTESNKNFAHVHEQSELTYGGYLVAAGHLQRCPAATKYALWVNSHCSGT